MTTHGSVIVSLPRWEYRQIINDKETYMEFTILAKVCKSFR